MKKSIQIEGMMCEHCRARVEKALNSVPGVKATVDLAKKTAVVEADGPIADKILANAVEEAGYRAVSITDAGEQA